MKKSIIIVALLLVVIAILPVVGNSYMKTTLDERVNELNAFGLQSKTDETSSSYLNTSRHLEFLLNDSEAFISYLNQFSDQQIPPYVHALVENVLLGVDISYSNLPFAKSIKVDIYPLALSKDAATSISKDDLDFSKYLSKFLESKGIFYHMEFNLLNDDFSGYLKDINEKYTFKDGLQLDISLVDTKFSGNGSLVAPKVINSGIKSLKMYVENNNTSLYLTFNNLTGTSNFNSKNTYLTSGSMDSFNIVLTGSDADANVSMDSLKYNGSSNDQGETTELNTKLSFDSFKYHSKIDNFELEKFTFDLGINGLDKDTYSSFVTLISKNSVQPQQQVDAVRQSAIELLAKGLTLNIAEFSIKKVNLEKLGTTKGFKIESKFVVKADPDMGQKIEYSPMVALQNIEIQTKMKLANELYVILLQVNPMLNALSSYAKKESNSVLFDIDFKDSKLTINGKKLN